MGCIPQWVLSTLGILGKTFVWYYRFAFFDSSYFRERYCYLRIREPLM